MVEFSDGIKGMALNLESDNVGVVILVMTDLLKKEILLKEQVQLLIHLLEKIY